MYSKKRKNSKEKKKDDSFVDEEIDSRYFLNPDAVSPHLYCSICQELFTNPWRAPCGHSYCKRCIDSWLKTSKTCPEDRKNLTENILHHDFILENIIGDIQVACKFRRIGCDSVLPLNLAKSHIRSCSFNPDNLPEFLKVEDSIKENFPNDITPEELQSTPPQPSLKMRLYQQGGLSRDLLVNAFTAPQISSITREQLNKITSLID